MAEPQQDDPAAPTDDTELGARIRTLRVERGRSLRALAEELGISPSALSQIERGKMRPSVTRLIQIMSLLDAPLAAAFGNGTQAQGDGQQAGPEAADRHRTWSSTMGDEVVVTRSGDVATLMLGQGVRYRRLSPVPITGLEIYESTYPPGSSSTHDDEYLRHDGHELGSVQSGTLTVDIGFDRYELGPGDAITFPSTTPHRISNHTAVPAVAVWVNLR
ncbi:helix-turn-helix domain-containing protein [Haloechinothrix halophila]|uniref:helix-turn-helix domain-containing protein n=1 Tax=Haloechinothrix halophila TaxID=1069073 RepID=UPI00040A10EA|nr:XRE family transcriptional regulator [Haloechinothrix halophila]